MTDLAITPANVLTGAGASITHGFAAEALTAGQAVYMDAATRKWSRADSNSPTVAAKTAGGIALNGAAINQPVTILTGGPITIGATMVLGAAYYLSDAPGGICPDADVAAGENVCLIGIAQTTAVLNVNIQAPGVTR